MFDFLNSFGGRLFEVLLIGTGFLILGYWLHWWLNRNKWKTRLAELNSHFESLQKKVTVLEAGQSDFARKTELPKLSPYAKKENLEQVDQENKIQNNRIAALEAKIAKQAPTPVIEEKPKFKTDSSGMPSKPIVEHLSIKNIQANESSKDDLKRINGIGPFIERKLNALGIYTFLQVSKLTGDDVNMVTDAIQFFPGRIQRDNWTQQAANLHTT